MSGESAAEHRSIPETIEALVHLPASNLPATYNTAVQRDLPGTAAYISYLMQLVSMRARELSGGGELHG